MPCLFYAQRGQLSPDVCFLPQTKGFWGAESPSPPALKVQIPSLFSIIFACCCYGSSLSAPQAQRWASRVCLQGQVGAACVPPWQGSQAAAPSQSLPTTRVCTAENEFDNFKWLVRGTSKEDYFMTPDGDDTKFKFGHS